MNRHIQKLSITLISLTMVLSGCGKADPDNHSWTINEEAIANAIALNSRIISHEGDLVIRLESEEVTFNSNFTKDAILIRDMGLELPEKDDEDNILTYEDIKAVSLTDYVADVVSFGAAVEITIPKAFKDSSFGAIIAPYATNKGVMAYASFSGSESVISLSEGNFEQIGADYVGGYDYNHTFVFKYESLTLSEDFDVEDISLLGAFENWVVKDIHTDTEGVIILETSGYPSSEESGAIIFDKSTFLEERGGAFSYRVLYPSAALVENSVRFDEDDKTFSFDVALIDCEIKKDFSLKNVTSIYGFTIKEAYYVAETKTASYVLDAEEFTSLTEVIAELEQLTISIGGEFDQEVAFDFHEPEVFAIASNENKKVCIDLYSFDGELTLEKSALTIDAEFLADVDEEELLPIDEATLTKVGKGYRLTWEKEIDYPVYGTLTIDSVDVSYPNGNKFTVVGSNIEFGCDYYQVDSEENRLIRPMVFRYVTPTSLAGMDDTFVRYAYDASLEDKATAISAANAAVQTVLTVLTVAFELAASELSKLACGGIIGVLLGALGLAGVAAALDPTAAMLQQILNVVSGINETVKRMEKTLSEVSYKTDMVLLRERLNSDENKLIALRARQLEFQSEDAKVKQYEKKMLTVANRYLTSIFDGNTNKKSKQYKAPSDYNVVVVEGKNKRGELEKTSTILLDDDSFDETFDEGTIVSSYAFSFGNDNNLKNTFKNNTLPKYKNKKTVDKVVGEAAISDIKAAITNNVIAFSTNEWSGSQIPDVSDDAKLEAVAKDIYRALYLFAEREALLDVDGESFVLQAVDYMQRFSGTGSYTTPAADIDYEMLKLTYGFQSEAEDKIHNYRITTTDRLIKIYNLATTICATDPDISSYDDLTKAYKASIAYLNQNKMVKSEAEKRAVALRSKIPLNNDAKLDYCYVSESWVRGGQLMTGFKATSDKTKEGKWQNFEIADVSGEISGSLQSNMNNVTPMSSVKPYLFGLEDMRVLLIRKQQNFPSYSNFNYLKDKLGLIRNYMINNNDINRREFTNEDDITKAICATNRFVYAYTGFKELGTHTEGDFFAYCSRSFTKEQDNDKNPDYFSLNQKIVGFPTDSKRELKYYRGWGLKGEFSDIENIMNVTASGYMNRFVNYNEDHGHWRNPENWGFSEFNSVGDLSHPSNVESIQFYYCLIRMY